jgi:hypothetical protein
VKLTIRLHTMLKLNDSVVPTLCVGPNVVAHYEVRDNFNACRDVNLLLCSRLAMKLPTDNETLVSAADPW